MKTGKKILTTLLMVVLVLLVAVVILTRVFGDRVLKIGIETGAEKALKVGVRLDNINLSILGGTLDLSKLEVDNPQGYQNPTLLTLGHTYAALNIKSLLSDTVEIEKIQLDDVSLTMEQKGLTNNLQEILKNLPTSDAPAQPGAKPSKNLKIKELQINGVAVKVKLLPIPGRGDTVTLKLSPITLTNLGNNEKINVAQLTGVILKAIAGGIMEQGKDLLPTDMLNDLGKGVLGMGGKVLKGGFEAGKGIIEGTGDVGKGIIEGAGDVGKGAGDAIKGIFKKKE